MSEIDERRITKDKYRDHLSTVNEKGGRNWIYPKNLVVDIIRQEISSPCSCSRFSFPDHL